MGYTRFLSIILAFFIFCPALLAQRTITGKVLSQEGEVLVGATLIICDADRTFLFVDREVVGTVTDLDGRYTLTLPDDSKYLDASDDRFRSGFFPVPLRDTFNILLTYYNPNYYKVKTREDFDSGRTFPVSATGLIFPLEIPPYPKGQIKKGMIEPKEKVLLEYVEIVNIAADGTVLKSAVIDEMGNFSFLWKFPRVRIS